ncbi:hypothetical protein Q5H93_06485 [Hymenobacter sp. ASUV-10]|uniref:DUF3828 domain-containing protein n=1 Tax=Hymenobacter aranciens TaxID=3063996 RepID=A0ABT9B9N3_9BACT|nr:hypothetical protein [Hymenobacter sp. ASUV-10]MDO7874373.1 hypothetical protein [Hymenobacter sp. ASUV-10]
MINFLSFAMGRYSVLLLASLGACQSASESRPALPPATVPAAAPTQRPSLSPEQTAVSFFTYYKRHRAALNALNLVANLADEDTTRAYAIDFDQTAQFVNTLQASGCVSPTYLEQWDHYFHRWADSLQRHPMSQGDVDGFAYELVLASQDGDEYVDKIGRVPKQVRYPAPDRALVTADFSTNPQLSNKKLFHLRHYAKGWLIDSITSE